MILEVLRTLKEFDSLGPYWHAWESESVFDSHCWHRHFLHHLCEGEPFVIIAKRGAQVRAVAPLQVCADRASSLCFRKTDRTTLVFGELGALSEQVPEVLASSGVRQLRCKSLRSDQLGLLASRKPQVERATSCPVLEIGDAEKRMAPRLLHDTERSLAKIGAWGTLKCTQVPANDSALINEFLNLNRAWWQARGHNGIASDDRERAFYCDVLFDLGALRRAWFSILTLDAEVLSILLWFSNGRCMAYYAGAHSMAVQRLGIGNVHLLKLVKTGRDQGYLFIDFLRGSEPYKYRFGARDLYQVLTLTVSW